MLPSHKSFLHDQLPGLLNLCFSPAAEGAGVCGEPLGALASQPLATILQHSLAQDAVKALYKVHGIQYIFGSISATLCE